MKLKQRQNETPHEFLARAFRWNRICNEALNARRARYSASPMPAGKVQRPNGPSAEYMQFHARATRVPTMSTRRAIWYGSGLVFGAALIVMAVFGMGQ